MALHFGGGEKGTKYEEIFIIDDEAIEFTIFNFSGHRRKYIEVPGRALIDYDRYLNKNILSVVDNYTCNFLRRNRDIIFWISIYFENKLFNKSLINNIENEINYYIYKKKYLINYQNVMNELLYSPDLGNYKNFINEKTKEFFNII